MKKQYTITEDNEYEYETYGYILYLTSEQAKSVEDKIAEKCPKDKEISIEQTFYTKKEVDLINKHNLNYLLPRLDFYEFETETTLEDWKDYEDLFYKGSGLKKADIQKDTNDSSIVYFLKTSSNTSIATPLVLKFNKYTISISASDYSENPDKLTKTSLIIFEDNAIIYAEDNITPESISKAINMVKELQ